MTLHCLSFFDTESINRFFTLHPYLKMVAFSTTSGESGIMFHLIVSDFPPPRPQETSGTLISVAGSHLLRGMK